MRCSVAIVGLVMPRARYHKPRVRELHNIESALSFNPARSSLYPFTHRSSLLKPTLLRPSILCSTAVFARIKPSARSAITEPIIDSSNARSKLLLFCSPAAHLTSRHFHIFNLIFHPRAAWGPWIQLRCKTSSQDQMRGCHADRLQRQRSLPFYMTVEFIPMSKLRETLERIKYSVPPVNETAKLWT
ncbi:hypothetical protein B0H14DRAFT_2635790 [Mycena olivaceomarginata]|nr:hypothetical protein B0H14DRAFT_2635790 [Mycena olivaceomarginata]